MSVIILGVDPGFGGALAWISVVTPTAGNPVPPAPRILAVHPMPLAAPSVMLPSSRPEISAACLSRLVSCNPRPAIVVLERVGSSPDMGVESAFRFGEGYGLLRGVFSMAGIPVRNAYPSVWKPSLGLSRDKDDSRAMAGKIFPSHAHLFKKGVKSSADMAEAVLLAYYGRQFLPR